MAECLEVHMTETKWAMPVSFYVFFVCRGYVLCHAAGLQSAEGVITGHMTSWKQLYTLVCYTERFVIICNGSYH